MGHCVNNVHTSFRFSTHTDVSVSIWKSNVTVRVTFSSAAMSSTVFCVRGCSHAFCSSLSCFLGYMSFLLMANLFVSVFLVAMGCLHADLLLPIPPLPDSS